MLSNDLTTADGAIDVQQLIDKLDSKAPQQWDVYRAALGHWVAKIKLSGQTYETSNNLLGAALTEILEWVPLPVVPRRKPVINVDDCSYEKGSYGQRPWEIRWAGRSLGPPFATKKDAQTYAALCADRSSEAAEEWIEHYGWSLGKIEGVDFRFAES